MSPKNSYPRLTMKLQTFVKNLKEHWSQHWWEFILTLDQNKLNWLSISENPNLSWKIIQNNPDKPWVWDRLSAHPNISLDIMKKIQINFTMTFICLETKISHWNMYYLILKKFGTGLAYQ